MRKYLRNLATVTFVAGLVAGLPAIALAHAIIVKAQPTADQHVPAGKLSIALELNARIDMKRSRLQLTWPDGTHTELPLDQNGPPNIMSATTTLTPGEYTLRWQVLAIDGHITRGDIPFTVDQ